MKSFDDFISNESSDINSDLTTISDCIHSLFKNNPNQNNFFIRGNNIRTRKIVIDRIYMKNSEINNVAKFDIQKLKMTDKGLFVYINFNLSSEIDLKTIDKELKHKLEFYYKENDIMSRILFNINSERLVFSRITDEKFKWFLLALYFSNESEIDIIIAESYEILLNKIKRDRTYNNEDIKIKFLNTCKKLPSCETIEFLNNYNVYDLRKTDSDDLLEFFKIIDEKYKCLSKYEKYNIINKINDFINCFYIYNNRNKKKIKKRYKKIDEIEKIFKIYDEKFKTASKTLTNRIHNLLPLILEETAKNKN